MRAIRVRPWRSMWLWTLVLLATGVAPTLAQESPPTSTITGLIRGVINQDTVPLPFALVEVRHPRPLARSANSDGLYRLPQIPPGRLGLRIHHAGYEPITLELTIAAGDTLQLDAILSGTPVHLGELDVAGRGVVTVGPDGYGSSSRAELSVGLASLRASPGIAEAGVLAAARRASGHDPSDPTGFLFMRGSAADLKLILLDGAPVYAPFHVGGLLDPIDATIVGRTELYLGGAPARYNGGLSHIFAIETRDPSNQSWLDAEADPLSGRVSGELANESAGLLFSVRGLHNMGASLYSDGAAPYGYFNGVAKATRLLGSNHRVSTTVFHNRESVNLNPIGTIEAFNVLDQSQILGHPRVTDARWENTAVSVRYDGSWGGYDVRAIASGSDYEADLPVGDSTLILFEGTNRRLHLETGVSWNAGRQSWHVGASVDRMEVGDHARLIHGKANRIPGSALDAGTVASAFVEGETTLRGVVLRGGLRGDHFPTNSSRFDLSPRISLLWPISDDALFRIAAGRYSQLTRRSDPAIESGPGVQNEEFLATDLLTVGSATHFVASLDQQLTPQVTAGVEGFVKSYTGLSELSGDVLNSSGMDLRLAAEAPSGLQGWLGYTMTWFWSDGEVEASERFSAHHLMNAGIKGLLPGGLRGGLQVSYAGGLPFVAVPVERDAAFDGVDQEGLAGAPAPATSPPLPDRGFLRVDFDLNATWTVEREGSRGWQITPYLRVINALNRRDAQFFYFDPWRDASVRPMADLPVLPLFGVRVAF